MGLAYLEGTVSSPQGSTGPIQFLVDSGAKYTLLPEAAWRQLGLTPQRTLSFVLADGTAIERGISECLHSTPAGIWCGLGSRRDKGACEASFVIARQFIGG